MIKKIYLADFLVVVVSLSLLFFAFDYARPMLISPIDNFETRGEVILFSVENADEILIDDNLNFSHPVRYEPSDGLEIQLEPGIYYWKATGVFGSEVRSFRIESFVDLKLVGEDGNYSVVNSGNVNLNVDVYNGTELVDSIVLSSGDSGGRGDKFVGGMR